MLISNKRLSLVHNLDCQRNKAIKAFLIVIDLVINWLTYVSQDNHKTSLDLTKKERKNKSCNLVLSVVRSNIISTLFTVRCSIALVVMSLYSNEKYYFISSDGEKCSSSFTIKDRKMDSPTSREYQNRRASIM